MAKRVAVPVKPSEFEHVMVDLETYGTAPGSIILSIGAVAFNPVDGIVSEVSRFYAELSMKSCAEAGLTTDASTVAWWSRQSHEARATLTRCQGDNDKVYSLKDGLEQFGRYLQDVSPNVKVWGNGSDFDNILLSVAYERCGLKLPWKFYNNRCYRTLTGHLPPRYNFDVHKETTREGTYHNALDDAITQAKRAVWIFKRLKLEPLDA